MKIDHRLRRLGTAALIAASTLVAMSGGAQAAEAVVMRLNFTPWGMHAQYYAAQHEGFYKAEGLDLEIRPAAAGQQNEVLIATGREQFGVSNVDSFIKARANGVPVVAIMADQPETPNSIITLASENITKPADLKGKKLSWFQSNVAAMIDPLLAAGGLKQSDINFVVLTRGSELQMLAAHQVDAIYGYYYGQPLTLEMKGFATNVMALKDYGVHLYGTIVYTSESIARKNPELARKFLRATLKGLIWTKDHMDEAMNEVVAVAPDRDHDMEVRKLKLIYDIYRSPDFAAGFGLMNDAKWQSSIDIMSKGEPLPRVPAPAEMYTNTFLQSLPESKQLAELIGGR